MLGAAGWVQENVFRDTQPSPPGFPFALLTPRTMFIQGKQQLRVLVIGKTLRTGHPPPCVMGSVENWQANNL